MVKLITFLLAFSISAFAEDYEIFNSLEGDLEVNKAISSQFEEENLNIQINKNEKKYCEGYASVIREEELERDNVGCFDANSTLQTLQYKKLDTVLKSSSFLIVKGNPIFSFDNLEIIWDEKGRKKFITIDIRTSIKQIYTKYSSNIERFIVARKNRLKDFKLLDEHTGILSWSSSKSSYCKDEAEKLEKDIKDKPILDELLDIIQKKDTTYQIKSITCNETTRKPQPPYETMSLQQDASNKLGLTPKNAMRSAQNLFAARSKTNLVNPGFSNLQTLDSCHKSCFHW